MSDTSDKAGFAESVKNLEMMEAGRSALPRLPLMARLDGRAFHTLTRKFDRPFDAGMSFSMIETAKALVEEFDPCCAYTQSDEITLAWLEPNLFDGRFQKMTSVLAGYASAIFHNLIQAAKASNAPKQVACFDCRVWQVPTVQDVIDVFVWREDDATKNSLSMAAQSVYSHKQLMGVNSAQKHDMLHAKGINWDKYPVHFKRGVYLKRVVVERKLTPEEIMALPEKARSKVADRIVKRNVISVLNMPPIRKYKEACRVLLGADLAEPVVRYEVVSADPLEYKAKSLMNCAEREE